jgi:hypothetical protein
VGAGDGATRWIGEDQRVFRSAVEFGRKKRMSSDWSCQPGPLIASYFACIACMISMTCRKRTTQSRGVAIALTQGDRTILRRPPLSRCKVVLGERALTESLESLR